MVPAFDMLWHHPGESEEGLYLSPGFDIRMATQGSMDLNPRIFYRYGSFEASISSELFPGIDYTGYSFGLGYGAINRKLGLIIGPEITRIYNRNPEKLQKAWGLGINTEIRYILSRIFSLSYIGNVKSRPEISKDFVYSGYIQLNILLYGTKEDQRVGRLQ